MHAGSENTDVKWDTLDPRTSQDLDKRAYAAQGSGRALVEAGVEVEMVEQDGDDGMGNREELGSSELDAGARDIEKRLPRNTDQEDEESLVNGKDLEQRQTAAEKMSEGTNAAEGVAKEKRSVAIGAEDGGLEVRGQMGGLKGE